LDDARPDVKGAAKEIGRGVEAPRPIWAGVVQEG
jgi:hypothetical protein